MPIFVGEWKEFQIGKLFDKYNLKKKKKLNKAYDLSLSKTKEFDTPVVNAKHDNNGIMYYGRCQDFDTITNSIDIVQNGASSTGDVFYQPNSTGVLYDAYLIKSKKYNFNASQMLFITSILRATIKKHFGYDNKAVWQKVSNLLIKLPVDVNGDPDWQYMDRYISWIKQYSKYKLTLIQ